MMSLFIETCMFLYLMMKSITNSIFRFLLPMKKKDVRNDIVLITGGNKGIGREIALEFVKYKPKHIVLWARDESTLVDVSTEIEKHGVPCSWKICDVSKREDVYKCANETLHEIGPVSILVNNAGIVSGKDFLDADDEDIQKTMEVNALAHFWTTKAFLPTMIERNHGHVVCMSSLIGLISIPGVAEYAASKFAVTGFMETLHFELANLKANNVHTTIIHPYLVDTQMFSGCTFRFNFLFPPLKCSYVAKKSVDAILSDSYMLIMPRIMYLVIALKSLLPTECIVLAQKFTGVDKTMTHFHGRKKLA